MNDLKLVLQSLGFTLLVIFLLAFASCSERYTQEELDAAVSWEQDRFDTLNAYTVATVAQLEADKDSLNLEIADLTDRLALAAIENSNLRGEITELNELNLELELLIAELRSKTEQLLNDLTLSQEKVELLSNEIAALEMNISFLNSEISTLTSDLEDAYTVITELNKTINQYAGYVTGLLSDLRGMSSNNSSLQSQIDNLNRILSNKNDTIKRLRNRVKNIKARNKKDIQDLLDTANSLSATPWAAYFKLVTEIKNLLD